MVIVHPGNRTFLFGSTRSDSPVTGVPEEARTEQDIILRMSSSDADQAEVHVLPVNLRDAQRSVSDLASRGRNWDGQGAAAVSLDTVELANRTLWELAQLAGEHDRVLPTPSVGVSPDGAVGFEWSAPAAYIAVECLGDRRSAYVRIDGVETERLVRSGNELWSRVEAALALVETAAATV